MRTSPSQFEMMVTFMESYGDLTKPANQRQGKAYNYQKWEELSVLLNSDGSGECKSAEKWRKVWTDLKNNTKKKGARIHRYARGTGGGPASTLKLSSVEERVLRICNVQSATGLEEAFEAGLPQSVGENFDTNTSQQHNVINTRLDEKLGVIQIMDEDGRYKENISPDLQSTVTPAPQSTPPAPWSTPLVPRSTPPATTEHPIPSQRSILLTASQRGSPRRQVRSQPYTQADRAAREFLHSDEEWRKFHEEKYKQQLAVEQERQRLRALELQFNNRLAEIGDRIVDVLDKIVAKL